MSAGDVTDSDESPFGSRNSSYGDLASLGGAERMFRARTRTASSGSTSDPLGSLHSFLDRSVSAQPDADDDASDDGADSSQTVRPSTHVFGSLRELNFQYQFGSPYVRRQRRRASTFDATPSPKPPAQDTTTSMAAGTDESPSSANPEGEASTSALDGGPSLCANQDAADGPSLFANPDAGAAVSASAADGGPSLFAVDGPHSLSAADGCDPSSSGSKDDDESDSDGHLAIPSKLRSLSEPYFRAGKPQRQMGIPLRAQRLRSTSEVSGDSSLTGSSVGGSAHASKSISRYRALSFLDDIDEPDAQGFTVLLRAIQVIFGRCDFFVGLTVDGVAPSRNVALSPRYHTGPQRAPRSAMH